MSLSAYQPALIALADGRVFRGQAFGSRGSASGEVVFNTAMSGYQEVLTDPSYEGQIVTMTCPEIGNVGVNPEDVESGRVHVAAFVVRNLSPVVSNWRAASSLDEYLQEAGVPGIHGVDTRALTRHIRERGAVNGIVTTLDVENEQRWIAAATDVAPMEGMDLVQAVSCREPYSWSEGVWGDESPAAEQLHVVAYDFGIKRNILRLIRSAGARVTVVPASTSAEDVLALEPDGIFLSNGPGDPAAVGYAAESVRSLLGTRPIFGICLGHQILALALGATTFKLKFGHRGANHPVQDRESGRVEVTSQNHGFAVDPESLAGTGLEMTHVNLNDGTCAGLAHQREPAFSVQYHPEASPGPHDALPHFGRFFEAMQQRRA